MQTVRVTFEYGIVIKKRALRDRDVPLESVLAALEVMGPLDEGAGLWSFGPFFGSEAQEEMVRRLTGLGLQYFDDFFDLTLEHPAWITFRAEETEP